MAIAQQTRGDLGLVDPNAQQRLASLGYEVVDLFSPGDLALLSKHYKEPVDLKPDIGHPSGFHATMYSLDLAYRKSVHVLVQSLVNEKLKGVLNGYELRIGNWVVKDPTLGDTTVPLHQDWSFVDESRHRTLNLWFPLEDVDERNGCLEVVAGSHLISTDHRAHTDRCRFDNIGPKLRQGYTKPVPMQAGQAIIYDTALVHCSAHNTSSRRRIAVNTLLVPHGVATVHAYRISPTQVEVFDVDEGFFLKHVPGTKPQDATSLGATQSATKQHGTEVLNLLANRRGSSFRFRSVLKRVSHSLKLGR